MKNTFIERLLYFMGNQGINDNQMTVNAGLSVGLVGKMRKGVTKSINSTTIERILHCYPQLNAHWLLTGEGEMLSTSANSALQNAIPPSFTELLAMLERRDEKIEQLSKQIGMAEERIKQLEHEKGSDAHDAPPSHTALTG